MAAKKKAAAKKKTMAPHPALSRGERVEKEPGTKAQIEQGMGWFRYLPIDKIRPSPFQVRHSDPTSPEIQELAKSLQAVGLLEPILVRPLPADQVNANTEALGVEYELIAGHRRWSAAGVAGFAEIGCLVKEMTDEEVQLALITENLQRENLDPFAEAEGLRMLHGLRPDWTYEQIAAELGRSPRWIATRRRLTELSPAWRKIIETHAEDFRHWGVAHFEEIAKLSAGGQAEILASFTDDKGHLETWNLPETLEELKQSIHFAMHDLASAPWKLDDATLVEGVCACQACDKRSGCQPLLFEVGKKAADRCLDVRCWDAKREAFLDRRKAELAAKHPKLAIEDKPTWNRNEVKKTDPKAVPTLITHGPEAGKLVYTAPTSSMGSGLRNAKPAGPKSLADRRAELEARRRALALQKYREVVATLREAPACARSKLAFQPTLVALVATFGIENESVGWMTTDHVAAQMRRRDDEIYDELWSRLTGVLSEWLFCNETPSTNTDVYESMWSRARWLANVIELPLEPYWQAAVEEIPEPKSWAKEKLPAPRGNAGAKRSANVDRKAAAAGERG